MGPCPTARARCELRDRRRGRLAMPSRSSLRVVRVSAPTGAPCRLSNGSVSSNQRAAPHWAAWAGLCRTGSTTRRWKCFCSAGCGPDAGGALVRDENGRALDKEMRRRRRRQVGGGRGTVLAHPDGVRRKLGPAKQDAAFEEPAERRRLYAAKRCRGRREECSSTLAGDMIDVIDPSTGEVW